MNTAMRHRLKDLNKRSAMTLIELLMVVFIMMLFVAAAAPLLRPNADDRKIREASRILNAYFAEAKAHAAQRNRPVGIAFDRALAVREGARDSNMVTRVYLVEVPPIYTGDALGSVASLTDPAGGNTPEGGYSGNTINGNQSRKIQLQFADAMLPSLFASYVPPAPTPATGATNFYFPFGIRFDNKGSYYVGVAKVPVDGAHVVQPPVLYYIWADFGTQLYSANTFSNKQFQLALPPINTSDKALDLPSGTVVDLQFSGMGRNGIDFFDSTRLNAAPIMIMFAPGGSVVQVRNGLRWDNALERVHFLVGTSKRFIETKSATNYPYIINPNASASDKNIVDSNLMAATSNWISINSQTGLVSTNDLAMFARPASNPPNTAAVQNYVQTTRDFATKLESKGGR